MAEKGYLTQNQQYVVSIAVHRDNAGPTVLSHYWVMRPGKPAHPTPGPKRILAGEGAEVGGIAPGIKHGLRMVINVDIPVDGSCRLVVTQGASTWDEQVTGVRTPAGDVTVVDWSFLLRP